MMRTTMPTSKPLPGKPSPKLAQMLREATPQQRENAIRVASNLLAIKARKWALRVAESSTTPGGSEMPPEAAPSVSSTPETASDTAQRLDGPGPGGAGDKEK